VLIAVMFVGVVSAASLAVRPSRSAHTRGLLFALTVLGTLTPYAIHGLQVYESLTTVSSAAGLAVGIYPALDRWIALLLLTIVLSALAAWLVSRTRPAVVVAIPAVMGVVYLAGFLPYALRNRPSGTWPTAAPKSSLVWAIVAGVLVTTAAWWRVRQSHELT